MSADLLRSISVNDSQLGRPAGNPVGRRHLEAELQPTDRAPASARALLDNLLREEAYGHLVDDARAVITELVTNAVLHAGAAGPLHLELDIDDGVHVAVSDRSAAPPVMRALTTDEESGRGLQIVQQLSVRWGVDYRAAGKRVWALVR